MIEFTDISMIESNGNFEKLKDIMNFPSWMIKTSAYLNFEEFSHTFELHCWNDASIHIINTDMPQNREMTNHLIQYMFEWAKENKWEKICVNKDILDHPEQYEFWLRAYRAGLVYNKVFEDQEQREIKKYEKIVTLSKEEDGEEEEN